MMACQTAPLLLALTLALAAASPSRQERDDFSFDESDLGVGFGFPFDSARELLHDLDEKLDREIPEFSDDHFTPFPKYLGLDEEFDRVGNLPLEAHFPHPPNFGSHPPSKKNRFSIRDPNIFSTNFKSSPDIFHHSEEYPKSQSKVHAQDDEDDFSHHSFSFTRQRQDKVSYEPSEEVYDHDISEPKVHQEVHYDGPEDLELTHKFPSRRAASHTRHSDRPIDSSYEVISEKEDSYHPPVYVPRPDKSSDTYKGHGHDNSHKKPKPQQHSSYSKPVHDSYKPSKSVHDSYKHSKPVHDSYKPGKPVHDSYKHTPVHSSYAPSKPIHDSYKPPQSSYKPSKPIHNSYKPAHDPYKPVHDSYKPIHDSYKPSKPFHGLHKPVESPYKRPHGKPKLLQPVYKSHKAKPLHDPYKPLEEHFYEDKPHKKGSIPGVAGVDYPVYREVPYTDFSCSSVPYRPGMYANVEAHCQVYHVCHDDRYGKQGAAFLCTNGTLFNQETFNCDWWYNVDCGKAHHYYELNADPHTNPYYQKPYEGPIHIPSYDPHGQHHGGHKPYHSAPKYKRSDSQKENVKPFSEPSFELFSEQDLFPHRSFNRQSDRSRSESHPSKDSDEKQINFSTFRSSRPFVGDDSRPSVHRSSEYEEPRENPQLHQFSSRESGGSFSSSNRSPDSRPSVHRTSEYEEPRENSQLQQFSSRESGGSFSSSNRSPFSGFNNADSPFQYSSSQESGRFSSPKESRESTSQSYLSFGTKSDHNSNLNSDSHFDSETYDDFLSRAREPERNIRPSRSNSESSRAGSKRPISPRTNPDFNRPSLPRISDSSSFRSDSLESDYESRQDVRSERPEPPRSGATSFSMSGFHLT